MAARAQDIGIAGEHAARQSIDIDDDRVLDWQIAVFRSDGSPHAPPALTLTLGGGRVSIRDAQLSTSSTTSNS